MMYWPRRAWAELRNEVFVLPSRTLVLVWVVGAARAALRLRRCVRPAHPHHDLHLRHLRRELGPARRLHRAGQFRPRAVLRRRRLYLGADVAQARSFALADGVGRRRRRHAVRLPGGLPLPAAARLVSLARHARFPADRPRPAVRLPGFFRRRARHLGAAAPDGDADRQLLRRRDLHAGDHFRPLAARRFQVRHRAARHSRRRSRGARFGHQYAALQDGGVRHCRGGRRLRRRACLLTTCGWPDLRPWKWRCPSRW